MYSRIQQREPLDSDADTPPLSEDERIAIYVDAQLTGTTEYPELVEEVRQAIEHDLDLREAALETELLLREPGLHALPSSNDKATRMKKLVQ